MKSIALVLLLACALSGAGCKRAEKKPEVTLAPTPPPTLAADAEKLQQAQMKAAAAHAQEHAASPTSTPASP